MDWGDHPVSLEKMQDGNCFKLWAYPSPVGPSTSIGLLEGVRQISYMVVTGPLPRLNSLLSSQSHGQFLDT